MKHDATGGCSSRSRTPTGKLLRRESLNQVIMAAVSTASAVQASTPGPSSGALPGHGPVTRPNMAAVGTIVWLASELMFFAGLFAMYFTIRSVSPDLWHAKTDLLNVPLAAANTLVLVISSAVSYTHLR